MKLIGVTGSFGSGKTTATGFFKKLGAATVDADRIVHELYAKDAKTKRKIAQAFGKSILKKDGSIDRRALSLRAFKNKNSLQKLCRIIQRRLKHYHPLCKREILLNII